MKSLIRALTLWLLLAALPFQGFASASMLLCGAPAVTAPAAMPEGHDHASMLAEAGDSHSDADCCATHACCISAALAFAFPRPSVEPQLASRIRLADPFPPQPVDLAVPERPPRPVFA